MAQEWTGKDFKAWRERVGYSISQVAHIFGVNRRTVTRMQEADTIESYTYHLCESVELIKQLQVPGLFFGNAKDLVLKHHAALIRRMEEAERIGNDLPLYEIDSDNTPQETGKTVPLKAFRKH